MGKQKRERKKPHKENPTGLLSVKDFEAIETGETVNENREAALEKVYEDVQSLNIEDRISALQTLESMSSDSTLAVQIATDGIAKKVGPLLLDPSIPVRTNAASALRFIATSGKDEAYSCLVKDDILTPLFALLQKYHAEWHPNLDDTKKKINDEQEAFLQAVTLLWSLCENSDVVIKHANEQDFVSILMKFLDVNTYGLEVATATAQCLLSLTEDNPVALKKLAACEQMLLNLLNLETTEENDIDMLCFKTPVAGILINMMNSIDCSSIGTACKVVTVLSDVLRIKCSDLLNKIVSILPHENSSSSCSAKKRVRESRKCLGAQQQALELIANMCSSDQNDNCSELEDSDPEEMEDVSMEDVPMDEKCDTLFPPELTEVFNNSEILKNIWEKTTAVDKDTCEILEQNIEGRSVLKQIHTLRCRAYLCLNNLSSNLEFETLGGVDSVHRIWTEIGNVVFKDTKPNDTELLEAAATAMAAGFQKLIEAKEKGLSNFNLTNMHPFSSTKDTLQLVQLISDLLVELITHELPLKTHDVRSSNIRAKLFRMLGCIVLTIINAPDMHKIAEHASTFMLNMCKSEPEVWVIAECLDVIMDVYAEDETDELAATIGLVDKLRHLVPIFKNKVGIQKKRLGENAVLVSTVNANLNRFIKYKEKRLRNTS